MTSNFMDRDDRDKLNIQIMKLKGISLDSMMTYKDYADNISTAWELLLESGDAHIALENNNGLWWCLIGEFPNTQWIGEGETAPIAICKAYLKWKQE